MRFIAQLCCIFIIGIAIGQVIGQMVNSALPVLQDAGWWVIHHVLFG